MAIVVGTENISETQHNLLRSLRVTSRISEIVRTLYQVVTDNDITTGRENLHRTGLRSSNSIATNWNSPNL